MGKEIKSCKSCGLDFLNPEDHALGDVHNEYCTYCTNPDGSLKSYEEVLALIAEEFVESQGIDKEAAKEMAREVMAKLPAWSGY